MVEHIHGMHSWCGSSMWWNLMLLTLPEVYPHGVYPLPVAVDDSVPDMTCQGCRSHSLLGVTRSEYDYGTLHVLST